MILQMEQKIKLWKKGPCNFKENVELKSSVGKTSVLTWIKLHKCPCNAKFTMLMNATNKYTTWSKGTILLFLRKIRMTHQCFEVKYPKCGEQMGQDRVIIQYDIFLCSENPGCADHVCRSVADAVKLVSSPPLADQIENVWIWGGGGVYKVSWS